MTPPAFTIAPLAGTQHTQAAALLTAHFPAVDDWATPEGALAEVQHALGNGAAFAATSAEGALLGWVGGFPAYALVYELHPLVVDAPYRGHGLGRALVARLEEAARALGYRTMFVGTDDDTHQTTLSLVDDLYTGTCAHIANIRPLDAARPHPYAFYQRLGYSIVGVLPDANGPRKPDILMAKRLVAAAPAPQEPA